MRAKRPFERDPELFSPAAIRLADRVYVYDNSVDGIEARLSVRTQDGS
ncbi:MAG TPA: hypothetical protein VGY54_14135 [Polyangiaceae bacterium]|nr:hypothetical protein [Polyangiaceae bacterium]